MSEQPPEGDNVVLGKGGTFEVPEWGFEGWTLWPIMDPEWQGPWQMSGSETDLIYAAPRDSEVARLNGLDKPPAVHGEGVETSWGYDFLYKELLAHHKEAIEQAKRESADKDALIAELRASHTREVTDWRDRLDNAWKATARAKKDDAKKDALIRGLVAKWREEANAKERSSSIHKGESRHKQSELQKAREMILRKCADELEAALRQAEQGGVA